jgi:hypothetical protein
VQTSSSSSQSPRPRLFPRSCSPTRHSILPSPASYLQEWFANQHH